MKIKDLTIKMLEILKEINIKNTNYLTSSYSQMRIMGLLYGKFMYNKSLKNFKMKYTAEQVIEATELSIEFLHKIDFNNLDDKHIINTVLNAISKQLEWNFFSDEELDDVSNMDL